MGGQEERWLFREWEEHLRGEGSGDSQSRHSLSKGGTHVTDGSGDAVVTPSTSCIRHSQACRQLLLQLLDFGAFTGRLEMPGRGRP